MIPKFLPLLNSFNDDLSEAWGRLQRGQSGFEFLDGQGKC
jgi:hypothetical protein